MHRGKRPTGDPLPDGVRQDTRKHTRHALRPDGEQVSAYLRNPDDEAWSRFRSAYLDVLERRFAEDPAPFDALARQASDENVWLGCSCPTKKNPDVRRCHTVLALGFMGDRYPELSISLPS
jgi:hypothetical protein